MEKGDFLEGIRAAIIDKDRSPLAPRGSTMCRAMRRSARC
jgi:hypothetical protein